MAIATPAHAQPGAHAAHGQGGGGRVGLPWDEAPIGLRQQHPFTVRYWVRRLEKLLSTSLTVRATELSAEPQVTRSLITGKAQVVPLGWGVASAECGSCVEPCIMSIAGAVIGVTHRGPGTGLNVGEVFAGYTIVRLLGAGGMGEAYLARRPPLSRREAFTILGNDLSADDDYRRRFIGEAELAAALWHPNIVRINDRGEFNGQLSISIDFVGGTGTATPPRERYPLGMPADQVATAIAAIARTLDYWHQPHNLLHRDVNLASVLLAEPGAGDEGILLGDFEIARNNIGDANGLTATNVTIGPFPYAASEQLTDEPIDGGADQCALAATGDPMPTKSTLFPTPTPGHPTSRLHRRRRRTSSLANRTRPPHPQLRRGHKGAQVRATTATTGTIPDVHGRSATGTPNSYVHSGCAGPAATRSVAWITIQSPSGDGL